MSDERPRFWRALIGEVSRDLRSIERGTVIQWVVFLSAMFITAPAAGLAAAMAVVELTGVTSSIVLVYVALPVGFGAAYLHLYVAAAIEMALIESRWGE